MTAVRSLPCLAVIFGITTWCTNRALNKKVKIGANVSVCHLRCLHFYLCNQRYTSKTGCIHTLLISYFVQSPLDIFKPLTQECKAFPAPPILKLQLHLNASVDVTLNITIGCSQKYAAAKLKARCVFTEAASRKLETTGFVLRHILTRQSRSSTGGACYIYNRFVPFKCPSKSHAGEPACTIPATPNWKQLHAKQPPLMLLMTRVLFLPAMTRHSVCWEKGLLHDFCYFASVCGELHDSWCQGRKLLSKGLLHHLLVKNCTCKKYVSS